MRWAVLLASGAAAGLTILFISDQRFKRRNPDAVFASLAMEHFWNSGRHDSAFVRHFE